MTVQPGQDVTFGEIVRSLEALQQEIRALRGEHVRRDLYDAHRLQIEASVARVEADCTRANERLQERLDSAERDRASGRRQLNLALIGAGVSLLVGLLGILIR
jgi:uncharacterized protein (DUF2252 family)